MTVKYVGKKRAPVRMIWVFTDDRKNNPKYFMTVAQTGVNSVLPLIMIMHTWSGWIIWRSSEAPRVDSIEPFVSEGLCDEPRLETEDEYWQHSL